MSLPGGVNMLVDEDELINQVELDDHRTLFITPSRIIAYRESSLLTEESVDTYDTAIERLGLEEGKKHVTVTFEYNNQAQQELQLPQQTMRKALKALLASVVRATNVVESDESIKDLYRFNELTIVVTDRRLIQHLGTALWAQPHTSIEYEAIRGINTEVGTVSTGVIIETTESTERLKVPQDTADQFVSMIEQSVCEYHDVSSLGILRGDPDAGEPAPEPDLDRLRPLQVGDETKSDIEYGTVEEQSTPTTEEEVADRLEELTDVVERQQEQLENTMETLEQLKSELNHDP